jgi:PKD repeat protein
VKFNSDRSSDDKGIVSYLWDFGIGDISKVQNPEFTFEFAGTFEVSLTVSDEEGLTDTAILIIEVEENEGYDASLDEFLISPNPASEATEVIINLEKPTSVFGIYLYDSSGRQVKKYDYFNSFKGNGRYTITLDDLSNGIYTIYVYLGDGLKPLAKKIIVIN